MAQGCWCCSVQPGSSKHLSFSANFCGNLALKTSGDPHSLSIISSASQRTGLHPQSFLLPLWHSPSQQGRSNASPYPTPPTKFLDEGSTRNLPDLPRLPSAPYLATRTLPTGDYHGPAARPLQQLFFAIGNDSRESNTANTTPRKPPGRTYTSPRSPRGKGTGVKRGLTCAPGGFFRTMVRGRNWVSSLL